MSQHTLQNNWEGAHDTALTVSWPCHRHASACPGADPRGVFLCTACVSPPGKGPTTGIPCGRCITPSLPRRSKSGPDPSCKWAKLLQFESLVDLLSLLSSTCHVRIPAKSAGHQL